MKTEEYVIKTLYDPHSLNYLLIRFSQKKFTNSHSNSFVFYDSAFLSGSWNPFFIYMLP